MEEGIYGFEPVSAWGGVSERAKHLVAALLERDPRKRLSAAQVLEHPWMTDAPGFTEEDSFSPPITAAADRRPWSIQRRVDPFCPCSYCEMMRDPERRAEEEARVQEEAERLGQTTRERAEAALAQRQRAHAELEETSAREAHEAEAARAVLDQAP